MMDDDPPQPSPDERELIWQAIQWECPHAIPSPKWHGFRVWKERVIDAEIERRRVAKIQRENHGRLYRGEPLIERDVVRPRSSSLHMSKSESSGGEFSGERATASRMPSASP
jgi:hypothetical protein